LFLQKEKKGSPAQRRPLTATLASQFSHLQRAQQLRAVGSRRDTSFHVKELVWGLFGGGGALRTFQNSKLRRGNQIRVLCSEDRLLQVAAAKLAIPLMQ
jgi:hypothetical protein